MTTLFDADVIIIGGGPAGLSSLLWCNSLGLSALLLERKPEVGGQMLEMHHRVIDYPGILPQNGRVLRDRFCEQISSLGLKYHVNAEVSSLDSALLTIHSSIGDLRAGAIVLAMGARKRRLGIPGEDTFDGKGVSFSATRDHPNFIGKEVVVIGGGDSAVENSLILARVCPKVTLIHRSDRFRARPHWLEEARKHPSIRMLTDSIVTAIHGGNAPSHVIVEDLRTGGHREISAQGVFIRIGMAPNSELVSGLVVMDEDGFVTVNQNQETSRARIYGAGDITRPVCLSVATAAGHAANAIKHIARERGQGSGIRDQGAEC
jgi:thioredoxin reductase (NADPH)